MKRLLLLSVGLLLCAASSAQIIGLTTVCSGVNYTYNSNCFQYSWSIIPASAGTILSQGPGSAIVRWSTSGTLVDGCNSLSVYMDTPPTGTITGLSTIACGSPSGYQVSYLASTNGTSINWQLPAGWTLVSGTLNSSQIWVHPSSSNGTMAFTTNTNAGCYPTTITKAVTHYTTTGPLTISSTTGPASLCEPASGNYTAFATGAASYNWTFATSTGTVLATGSGVMQSNGYSSYWVYPVNPGSYRVKVSAVAPTGCGQSNSSTITMSLNYYASGSPQCGGGPNRMATDIPNIIDEELPDNSAGIVAYPVPASKSLHVSIEVPMSEATITLRSINSTSRLELKTREPENDIDIQSLTNGIYILEVIQGMEVHRQKVIVRQ